MSTRDGEQANKPVLNYKCWSRIYIFSLYVPLCLNYCLQLAQLHVQCAVHTKKGPWVEIHAIPWSLTHHLLSKDNTVQLWYLNTTSVHTIDTFPHIALMSLCCQCLLFEFHDEMQPVFCCRLHARLMSTGGEKRQVVIVHCPFKFNRHQSVDGQLIISLSHFSLIWFLCELSSPHIQTAPFNTDAWTPQGQVQQIHTFVFKLCRIKLICSLYIHQHCCPNLNSYL